MNINHSKSMTTLTITLPDDKIDVITAISTIIKNAGGSINIDDDSYIQTKGDTEGTQQSKRLTIANSYCLIS